MRRVLIQLFLLATGCAFGQASSSLPTDTLAVMVQTLSAVPESYMDDGYAAKVMQLSKSLSHAGRLKEAISWGQKAVNINKQLHGTQHLNYAQALSDLAGYYSHAGN